MAACMCLVLAAVGSGSRPFYAPAIVVAPSVVRVAVMPPAPCVVQDTWYPVNGHPLLSPQSRPRGTASKSPRRRIRCVVVYIGVPPPLCLFTRHLGRWSYVDRRHCYWLSLYFRSTVARRTAWHHVWRVVLKSRCRCRRSCNLQPANRANGHVWSEGWKRSHNCQFLVFIYLSWDLKKITCCTLWRNKWRRKTWNCFLVYCSKQDKMRRTEGKNRTLRSRDSVYNTSRFFKIVHSTVRIVYIHVTP
jgi:hypothetical protein